MSRGTDMIFPRSERERAAAFTMVEMMFAMGATVIVVGALLLSAISLRRALNSSETYAEAYSDQRRLTDYIGRDLRRAVSLAVTDDSGTRTDVAGTAASVLLGKAATLIVTLPAYYRSNTRDDVDFETPLDVVADPKRLDYGTAAGLAQPVEVIFRKQFDAKEQSVCFIREEAGIPEIIVRKADALFVQVGIAATAQECTIKTWFRSTRLGPAPVVSTFDRLLLRNPPLNYMP